jgi:uncharacterized protein (DUF58 family)
MIAGLGARVHLFARPAVRERLVALFRDTLGCTAHERDFGLAHPMLLVTLPDGSAFSVEFSDLAPAEPERCDDSRALRGAWLEFLTDDVATVHERLDGAGVPSFSHPGSPERYFCAPGGQVFRVVKR